ncbi:MAG: HupE/UreJ family protein [Pseudomonadota bacterium]
MSRLFLTLALIVWASSALAHRTELAVLKLVETNPGTYSMSWELRPNTELGQALEPVFPAQCTRDGNVITCGDDGLAGTLGFELIGEGQPAAMFKIRGLDGQTQVHTLTPASPTVEVSPNFDASSWAGMAQIFEAYLFIGIEHILLGIDHLLFVFGLIWVARGRWMLFKVITAFTLAHTVTLVAVTFGWIGVPEDFVNAMIALSIVFIGVEVLKARDGAETWTLSYPWAVSIFFGLLHGFGFANALVALGLPAQAVPLALLSFNLGVEIGQIAFVLVVLAMGWVYRSLSVPFPRWALVMPAYLIGGIASFWFIDRVAVMLGA